MEYKEWHDAKGVFHSQRRIYFSAANANKILSLHELVKMAADIAVEDYRTRGMSREFLTRAKSTEFCTQARGLRTKLDNKLKPCENSFIRAEGFILAGLQAVPRRLGRIIKRMKPDCNTL